MRLGGPIFENAEGPQAWAREVRRLGYGAAFCPLNADADDATVRAYEIAAKEADVVIAEVGAWSNPLSPDASEREKALQTCQRNLDLADRIGARCCVNISGSRGARWDGPHQDNLTQDTFDLIVETVRQIIDAVRPSRTYYTLETMPWMYPDSPESYLRLLRAVDRKRFAVHFDPVNLVCSPQRYFGNGALIRECFERLGPRIRSCHAKDILLQDSLTTHLDEVRPGTGFLDYRAYLRELARLERDVPLMLEHLPDAAAYAQAADHLRSVAHEMGEVFV